MHNTQAAGAGFIRDLERNNESGTDGTDQESGSDGTSSGHESDSADSYSSRGSKSDDERDSSEEAWHRVVTFVESHNPNLATRSSGLDVAGDRDVLNRSASVSSQQALRHAASSSSVYSQHQGQIRLSHARPSRRNASRSRTTLEWLRTELANTLEPERPPANPPSHSAIQLARERGDTSSFSPRSSSLQPDEWPVPPQLNIAAQHWMAATDLYDSNRATLPHDQNHKHLYRSFDTSDDESTQPISHLVGQDMSVLDMGRPYRARESSLLAFQLDNLSASPDDDHRTTDFQHSLPHIVTMASAHDRGGGSNNNTEAGIDDLPPMRLGHEISNDLRNIQLTFSNQPPARERSANPLKHLIRSRHNFRALVTYGGYLFPINILLNVILLGRGWLAYPTVETDGNIHTVSNPVGYLATSVVSLVLIVCSGVCFILRCIEYDVVITTMTSIIANFVNAVLILAIAIMYLKNERPKHPGARLTGEYYCSYAGAMVALLNALLLLLDVLVTPGFRYRGSGMSRQQRLLQFNIIVVVVWIGIGGYVWSKIEDWDTITSVMFCMVSVTTIGFGNRSPTKVYSRVLILIYGPLGILMFGMMLLHTRNVIIQITKSKFSRAKRGLEARRKKIEQEATLHQVKRRLAAHPEQRSCKSVVVGFLGRVFLPHERRVRIGIPRWLRRRLDEEEEEEDEQPHYLGDMSNSNRGTGLSGHGTAEVAQEHGLPLSGTAEGAAAAARESHPGSHNSQHFAATDHSPPHENSEHAGDTGNSDQPPHPVVRSYTTASRISQVREAINRPGFLRRIRRRAGADGRRRASDSAGSASDHDSETKPEDAGGNGRLELQANYTRSSHDSAMGGQVGREASRASGVSKKSGNKSKYGQRGKRDGGLRDITKQLWVALLLNIFFWCASACIFFAFERPQWTYFDALYFCYVAYTTIGYGDIVPKTTEGEIAFICLCFVAVGLETFLVVSAVSYFSDLLSRGLRRTRVQRRIEKRRRSLIAYEIRRHIKHPNYNPFSHGEEDRLVQEGITSLKRAMAHVVELFRGKRSLKNAFKRRHTADQRQRDEVLAEGFIRQATGLGGFGMTEWQPPSPPASPVTSPLGTPQPFPQSPHASPAETPSLSESPDEPRAETQALENHQPEPATGSANASPTA